VPEHARVRLAHVEQARDLRVAPPLGEGQPHHVSRALRELADAILEVNDVVVGVLEGLERKLGELRSVLRPELLPALSLASPVEGEVPADAEDEAGGASGIFHGAFSQRLDEQQEDLLGKLLHGVARSQAPTGEGADGGDQTLAEDPLGHAVTALGPFAEVTSRNTFGRGQGRQDRTISLSCSEGWSRKVVTVLRVAPLHGAEASLRMKPALKKTLIGIAATFTAAVAGLTMTTAVRQHRTFDAPYPAIRASQDPQVIERGRYLAYGPAHCVDCHGEQQNGKRKPGEDVPLIGGFEFHLPFGVFRAPNITPDRETGIGSRRDDELARMLRHGVRPDGTAVLPFMPFANLTDEDLTAVISFLRAQKPVRHVVAPDEVNAVGSMIKAFMLEPKGPTEPIRQSIPEGPTVEYGRYLANSVANCVNCHTKIDLATLAYAGPLFGGGEAESHVSARKFHTPNLTPHPKMGWLTGWSEDAFVARMKAGPVYEDSPMPWESFRKLKDDDARALYRYFQSLPPAESGPDPSDRSSVVMKNEG
jgi:mono/diheme cytochrome c family protein